MILFVIYRDNAQFFLREIYPFLFPVIELSKLTNLLVKCVVQLVVNPLCVYPRSKPVLLSNINYLQVEGVTVVTSVVERFFFH